MCGPAKALRARALRIASFLLMVCSARCIVEDNACSKNQVARSDDFKACLCAPGYVLAADGYRCVSCGEHAHAMGDSCECDEGYVRASPDGACEKIEGSAAGSSCSDDEPCSDPNPYCAESGDSGYCTTRGCARNDECAVGWSCSASGDDRICRKPPLGLGNACASNEDCAETEAKYCESFMVRQCMISDCARAPQVCPNGYLCCDLSALIGQSLCLPTALLTGGTCPAGAKLVSP